MKTIKTILALTMACAASMAAPVLAPAPTVSVDANSTERVSLYEPSPLEFAIDISYANSKYKAWEMAPGMGVPGQSHGVLLNFEWIVPEQRYGKFGVGIGAGFEAHPNAVVGTNADGSNRYATLSAMPVSLTTTYRAQYYENQPLVPFGRFGASCTFASQTSKTGGQREGVYGGMGLDYGGGLEFALHTLDGSTQRRMDTTAGVNGTYLVAEYAASRTLQGGRFPDLSRDELRFGLRFEF